MDQLFRFLARPAASLVLQVQSFSSTQGFCFCLHWINLINRQLSTNGAHPNKRTNPFLFLHSMFQPFPLPFQRNGPSERTFPFPLSPQISPLPFLTPLPCILIRLVSHFLSKSFAHYFSSVRRLDVDIYSGSTLSFLEELHLFLILLVDLHGVQSCLCATASQAAISSADLSPDSRLAHSTTACHLLCVPNCSLKFQVSEASFWTPKPASKQPQVLLLHLLQLPSALLLKHKPRRHLSFPSFLIKHTIE